MDDPEAGGGWGDDAVEEAAPAPVPAPTPSTFGTSTQRITGLVPGGALASPAAATVPAPLHPASATAMPINDAAALAGALFAAAEQRVQATQPPPVPPESLQPRWQPGGPPMGRPGPEAPGPRPLRGLHRTIPHWMQRAAAEGSASAGETTPAAEPTPSPSGAAAAAAAASSVAAAAAAAATTPPARPSALAASAADADPYAQPPPPHRDAWGISGADDGGPRGLLPSPSSSLQYAAPVPLPSQPPAPRRGGLLGAAPPPGGAPAVPGPPYHGSSQHGPPPHGPPPPLPPPPHPHHHHHHPSQPYPPPPPLQPSQYGGGPDGYGAPPPPHHQHQHHQPPPLLPSPGGSGFHGHGGGHLGPYPPVHQQQQPPFAGQGPGPTSGAPGGYGGGYGFPPPPAPTTAAIPATAPAYDPASDLAAAMTGWGAAPVSAGPPRRAESGTGYGDTGMGSSLLGSAATAGRAGGASSMDAGGWGADAVASHGPGKRPRSPEHADLAEGSSAKRASAGIPQSFRIGGTGHASMSPVVTMHPISSTSSAGDSRSGGPVVFPHEFTAHSRAHLDKVSTWWPRREGRQHFWLEPTSEDDKVAYKRLLKELATRDRALVVEAGDDEHTFYVLPPTPELLEKKIVSSSHKTHLTVVYGAKGSRR